MKINGWMMYRGFKSYFSLLEVILALFILAGSITALLKDRSISLRRTTITSEDRRAQQLLKSKMAELILKIEEDSDGDFENHRGFHWTAFWDDEEIEGLENFGNVSVIKLSVFTPSQNEHLLIRYLQ